MRLRVLAPRGHQIYHVLPHYKYTKIGPPNDCGLTYVRVLDTKN